MKIKGHIKLDKQNMQQECNVKKSRQAIMQQ